MIIRRSPPHPGEIGFIVTTRIGKSITEQHVKRIPFLPRTGEYEAVCGCNARQIEGSVAQKLPAVIFRYRMIELSGKGKAQPRKNMLHRGLNLLAIPDEMRKIAEIGVAEMVLGFAFNYIIPKYVITTEAEILKTPAAGEVERYAQANPGIELVPLF